MNIPEKPVSGIGTFIKTLMVIFFIIAVFILGLYKLVELIIGWVF